MIQDYLKIIYQQEDIYRPYPFEALESYTWEEYSNKTDVLLQSATHPNYPSLYSY